MDTVSSPKEDLFWAIKEEFLGCFRGRDGVFIVRLQGRMNLIGEHTDYDDGFVLPAAINRSINSAISKGRDSKCRLYASNIQERCESYLARFEKSSKRWADYLMGVVNQLQKAGYSLLGVERLFGADTPMGAELEPVVYNRCRYVLEENNRVESACKALATNGYKRLGELLYDSHNGLRNKYDVSCEELDFPVESATRMDGVVGARMMGAGFGGCTSNLVTREFMHGFEARIERRIRRGRNKSRDSTNLISSSALRLSQAE